jgi:hypothetical protein
MTLANLTMRGLRERGNITQRNLKNMTLANLTMRGLREKGNYYT